MLDGCRCFVGAVSFNVNELVDWPSSTPCLWCLALGEDDKSIWQEYLVFVRCHFSSRSPAQQCLEDPGMQMEHPKGGSRIFPVGREVKNILSLKKHPSSCGPGASSCKQLFFRRPKWLRFVHALKGRSEPDSRGVGCQDSDAVDRRVGLGWTGQDISQQAPSSTTRIQ